MLKPAPPLHTEPELLRQVAAGDEIAFRKIYDAWHARVYSLSMYLTRSAYMSEEITQEVFVKIWNARHQLTDINYFSSWVRTIVRNTLINHLRLKAREAILLQQYKAADDTAGDTTANTIQDRENSRILRMLVQALPAQQRKVWMLTKESGLTLAQAAEEMGVTRHTAKEHLSRAVATIKTQLDGHIELVVTAAIAIFL